MSEPRMIVQPLQRLTEQDTDRLRGWVTRAVARTAPEIPAGTGLRIVDAVMEVLTRAGV